MLTKLNSYLTQHPKLKCAALVALALLLGAAFGKFTNKPKTTVQYQQVVDQTVKTQLDQTVSENTSLKEQLTTALKTINDLNEQIVTKTHEVIQPNGTTIIDTTKTVNQNDQTTTNQSSSTTVASNDSSTSQSHTNTDTTTHIDTKETVKVDAMPRWYLGATFGANFRDLTKPDGYWNIGGVVTPGVEAKYRLLGPVWVGVGLDTGLRAKASLGVTF